MVAISSYQHKVPTTTQAKIIWVTRLVLQLVTQLIRKCSKPKIAESREYVLNNRHVKFPPCDFCCRPFFSFLPVIQPDCPLTVKVKFCLKYFHYNGIFSCHRFDHLLAAVSAVYRTSILSCDTAKVVYAQWTLNIFTNGLLFLRSTSLLASSGTAYSFFHLGHLLTMNSFRRYNLSAPTPQWDRRMFELGNVTDNNRHSKQ